MGRRRGELTSAPTNNALTNALTVHDLHAMRHARASVNHETYKMMLRQLYDRVRARAANKFTDLVFQVPPLVPGRPLYTVSHASRYLSEKMRRGGFDVSVDAPHPDVHTLYVSWARGLRKPPPPPPPRKHAQPAGAHHQPAGIASLPASMAEASRSLDRLKAQLKL